MEHHIRYNVAFGLAVRERRRVLKKSQDLVALDAKLDRTYVALLELGQRSPSLNVIVSICRALEISFPALALRVEELLVIADDK